MHPRVRLWIVAYYILAWIASLLAGSLVATLLTGWPSILVWVSCSSGVFTLTWLCARRGFLPPKKKREPAIPAPDGYHFGEDHVWGPDEQLAHLEWIRMLRDRDIEGD